MRGLLFWFLLVAVVQAGDRLSVGATSVVIPGGAATFEAPATTVVAPPPLSAAGPLVLSEIPAVSHPAGFLLSDPAGRRYGPFAFEDGAAVGAATAPYTLALARNGTFTLIDPRTRAAYGPFTATNGAAVAVGTATLAFTRLPGSLRIRLAHRATIGTAPLVAVGELTPAAQAALYELRAALVEVANRLAYETAPVTIENRPTIITPSGHRYTPTVRKSLRDRETARRAADTSAAVLLEAFMRAHLRLRLQRDEDGSYLVQPMPAGPCLAAALWRVRDGDAVTAAASRTAVWWTPVAAGPQADARLEFNEAQAGDWRAVFRLPALRD